MKITEALNAARLRAGAWNRERKERAAEKRAKAAAQAIPGAPSESLIRSVRLGAWGAYCALMWFLWERVLHVSQAQYETLHVTHALWFANIDLSIFFPLIVGYVAVVFTVPYIAKFAIPLMVSLSFREHFWAKSWAVFITLLVSIVLISGTATVGGMAVVESERGAAVAVQQVQQEAAVMTAQIQDVQHAMDERTRSPSAYVRTAASMSPAAYDAFLASRVDDPQYARLRSYRAVSEEMVALNTQMSQLRAQQARQQVTASVSSDVVTARSAPISGILGYLNAFWILLLAAVMDIACLFLPWLAETLEQKRNRMVFQAGGIPRHRYMLNDMTPDAAPASAPSPLSREEFTRRQAPMDANYKGEVIYDEKGRELKWVEGFVRQRDNKFIPGHYRPTGGRQKREIEVEVNGKTFMATGAPDDDAGVPADLDGRDAELRAASMHQPVEEWESAPVASPELAVAAEGPAAEQEAHESGGEKEDQPDTKDNDDEQHPEPPEETLSAEGLEALNALSEETHAALDTPQAEADSADEQHAVERDEQEAEEVTHNEPQREPETDPARLIAAVAAE